MSPASSQADSPTSSMPHPASQSFDRGPSIHPDDHYGSAASSRSGSTSEAEGVSKKMSRPRLHTRKSSGTIIVPSHAKVEVDEYDEEYDEGDARTMSPRRSSEEVDRLEQCAKQAMIEYVHHSSLISSFVLTATRQAKQLQASLLSLCERVDSVKAEHEKLEGGNAFLQSYVLSRLLVYDVNGSPVPSDTLASSCKRAKSRRPVLRKARAKAAQSELCLAPQRCDYMRRPTQWPQMSDKEDPINVTHQHERSDERPGQQDVICIASIHFCLGRSFADTNLPFLRRFFTCTMPPFFSKPQAWGFLNCFMHRDRGIMAPQQAFLNHTRVPARFVF